MMQSAAQVEDLVGRTLAGSYRIVKVLDRGGMSVVYQAEHLRLHRPVAIKVLPAHLQGNAKALARFAREAEVIAGLEHPHIVQIVDYDTSERSEPFIAMELLTGESLLALLERVGALSIEETLHVVAQVASGLAAAHAAGIVHRDLKPANVFLVDVPGEVPFVKLLDFGISKITRPEGRLTLDFDILGTPDYMAPEQARGLTHQLGPRADQFALGTLAYECLTGRPPFVGGDVVSVMYQIINEAAPPVTRDAPWLPPAVDAVLQRAFSKDPNERFEDVLEFASQLAAAAGVAPSIAPRSWRPSEHAALKRKLQASLIPTAGVAMTSPPDDPARSLLERMERARAAYESGALDAAVGYAEQALDFAARFDDPAVRAIASLSEPAIARIFEARVGRLDRRLRVRHTPSTQDRHSLASQRAFLLSRLDAELSLDETLDVSAMSRRDAMRCLAGMLRDGIVEVV